MCDVLHDVDSNTSKYPFKHNAFPQVSGKASKRYATNKMLSSFKMSVGFWGFPRMISNNAYWVCEANLLPYWWSRVLGGWKRCAEYVQKDLAECGDVVEM